MKVTRKTTPAREAEKYILRFPAGMRKEIEDAAAREGRSMNADMIVRLRASLDHPLKRWAPEVLIGEIDRRAQQFGVSFEQMLTSVLAAGMAEGSPQVLYISVAPGSTAQDLQAALDVAKTAAPPSTPVFVGSHSPETTKK